MKFNEISLISLVNILNLGLSSWMIVSKGTPIVRTFGRGSRRPSLTSRLVFTIKKWINVDHREGQLGFPQNLVAMCAMFPPYLSISLVEVWSDGVFYDVMWSNLGRPFTRKLFRMAFQGLNWPERICDSPRTAILFDHFDGYCYGLNNLFVRSCAGI